MSASPRPPLTVQADTYVELVLSGHLEGCMTEASTVSLGQVPVEYRLFGVIERHTVITMPMTVTVTGQRDGVCSAG